jgi:hypothetical protein
MGSLRDLKKRSKDLPLVWLPLSKQKVKFRLLEDPPYFSTHHLPDGKMKIIICPVCKVEHINIKFKIAKTDLVLEPPKKAK